MNIIVYKDQTDGHDRAVLFATQDLMAKWANEHRDATFMAFQAQELIVNKEVTFTPKVNIR